MKKTRRDEVLRKMRKSKSLMFLMVFGFVFILGSGVFAYWIYSYNSTSVYSIRGGASDLIIDLDFTDQLFNVNETLSINQSLTIDNKNSPLTMFYNMSMDYTGLDGGCSGENDVSYVLSKTGLGDLTPGQNFTMDVGINDFILDASVENTRSCDADQNVTISFTE